MSTPQHGIQSGLLAYAIWDNPIHIAIAIILGILPDVGRFLTERQYRGYDPDWTIYQEMHRLSWVYLLIPYYNLHILVDKPLHRPEGGWTALAYWIEGIAWVATIIIFYFIWR